MKKQIAVLSLATASIYSSAFAETGNVNVYGAANLSLDVVNNGSAGATQGISTKKVSSNASRIGIKGSIDLQDSLKAVWQVESLVAIDNAGGTFATRNSFAGLSGDKWGTVLLGRYDTPYKISTRKLDMFSDSIADNRSLMGGVAAATLLAATSAGAVTTALAATSGSSIVSFDARNADVLTYTSPVFNGFSGALAYVAGAESVTTSGQSKGSAKSLAGMYEAGPIYGSLAYEAHDFGTTTATTGNFGPATGAGLGNLAGKKESAWKAGASYKFNAIEVHAVYEKTRDDLTPVSGANLLGHSAYYLGGKYSIGSDAVKLAYTHAGNLEGAASGTDTSAKQISLGYDHEISKRATVYAL